MKLVAKKNMTDAEARHAVPPDEAASLFQRSLENHESIEGLAELRQELPTSFNSDVIDQLTSGEWQLVDDAAYRFDWGQFNDRQEQHKSLLGDGAMPEKAKIIVGHAICPFTSFRKEAMRHREVAHGLEAEQQTGQSGDTGIIDCSHHIHTEAMIVQLMD